MHDATRLGSNVCGTYLVVELLSAHPHLLFLTLTLLPVHGDLRGTRAISHLLMLLSLRRVGDGDLLSLDVGGNELQKRGYRASLKLLCKLLYTIQIIVFLPPSPPPCW